MSQVKKVYDPKEIEARWSQSWADEGVYQTSATPKKPVYVLGMFPYPSGDGLHTGHVRIYTATDVLARFFRQQGFDVLLPMGWDAFGLPAENAAIKAKTNPNKLVPLNEANFRRQMEAVGLSFDWDRAFSTTDPDYYRWTQWIFLQLYNKKNEQGERLIYRQEVAINWCPFCKTGLANEEVLADGTHERCGTPIEQKNMPQWLMRITDYADPLLNDLTDYEWVDETGKKQKGLDWPQGILQMQKHWIGRKSGANVKFAINKTKGVAADLEVFTTRLDTLFGVTFVAIAPELAQKWLESGWKAKKEVGKYVEESLRKLEQQRLEDAALKTGVDTGLSAVHPLTGELIPIYVADYVLGSVGTGALMGVPAHDQRDLEFAAQHKLPVRTVVCDHYPCQACPIPDKTALEADGWLVNSGLPEFDGLTSEQARGKILEKLEAQKMASQTVTYHLRDWVFSRQRYWGEPIPLVYCGKCGDENGVVPLKEDQLPLTLPDLESYEPSDDGKSPLAAATDWVQTSCPSCGGKATRETDTMPNWAGSCWYFLRFADPKNDEKAWSGEALDRWLPVNWYLGGAEHAVLHLLYARFWVKVLSDLGQIKFREPFLRLRSVGMVLAEDGRKMSKSIGNVVTPDSVIDKYGADALRIYELFMGPWDQAIAWETRSLVGCYRFLEKFWHNAWRTLQDNSEVSDPKLSGELNGLIGKLEMDIPALKFNTSVAATMEFTNAWKKSDQGLSMADLGRLVTAIAPLAPFIAEELHHHLGGTDSVHLQPWPEKGKVLVEEVTVVVQVNGKLRANLVLDATMADDETQVATAALQQENVSRYLENKQPRKTIFVPRRLINFVV